MQLKTWSVETRRTIMLEKQRQQAGDNSTQTIIETQVVLHGIDEARATEIARNQAQIAIRERFESESIAVANNRISRFDQKIIAKLAAQEMLDIFGDPSFLSVFQKAQISAAQTDTESDYEILSGLLSERAKRDTRKIRASVAKAVELIDLIDEEALTALTAFWVLANIVPVSGVPEHGLGALEEVYTPFIVDDLVPGTGWLAHLDSLNVVRHEIGSGLRTFSEFISSRCAGYVTSGFNLEEKEEISQDLRSVFDNKLDPGLELLSPHQYRPGYWRLPFKDKEGANQAYMDTLCTLNLNEVAGHEDALRKITDRIGEPNSDCVILFQEEYRRQKHISKAELWWDQINSGVTITPIGKAIAYVNAKRFHTLEGIDGFEHWIS